MRACKEKVGREPKPEKWDMPVALGIFRDGYDDLHSSSSREALGFSTSRGIPQKHGAPQKNISEAPTPPAVRELLGPQETVLSVTMPIVPLIIALRKTVDNTSTKGVCFICLNK